MKLGSQDFEAAAEQAQLAGAQFIQIAASLGFVPARRFIVSRYGGSRTLRAIVPAADAIRYALDDFILSETEGRDIDRNFADLAAYFIRVSRGNYLPPTCWRRCRTICGYKN